MAEAAVKEREGVAAAESTAKVEGSPKRELSNHSSKKSESDKDHASKKLESSKGSKAPSAAGSVKSKNSEPAPREPADAKVEPSGNTGARVKEHRKRVVKGSTSTDTEVVERVMPKKAKKVRTVVKYVSASTSTEAVKAPRAKKVVVKEVS